MDRVPLDRLAAHEGLRRMLWLQRSWGKIAREGCATPWDKSEADSPVCDCMHGQTAHKWLIQGPT